MQLKRQRDLMTNPGQPETTDRAVRVLLCVVRECCARIFYLVLHTDRMRMQTLRMPDFTDLKTSRKGCQPKTPTQKTLRYYVLLLLLLYEARGGHQPITSRPRTLQYVLRNSLGPTRSATVISSLLLLLKIYSSRAPSTP